MEQLLVEELALEAAQFARGGAVFQAKGREETQEHAQLLVLGLSTGKIHAVPGAAQRGDLTGLVGDAEIPRDTRPSRVAAQQVQPEVMEGARPDRG